LPPDCLAVYNSLKSALVSEPIVDYTRKNRPYSPIVDPSTGTTEVAGGLGNILTQTDKHGDERLIAYLSTQLLKHEKNHIQILVEMKAMMWVMDHFDNISEDLNSQCSQTIRLLKPRQKGTMNL
jgi:hypothetical protein